MGLVRQKDETKEQKSPGRRKWIKKNGDAVFNGARDKIGLKSSGMAWNGHPQARTRIHPHPNPMGRTPRQPQMRYPVPVPFSDLSLSYLALTLLPNLDVVPALTLVLDSTFVFAFAGVRTRNIRNESKEF
jgi:hypothetical protein